MEKEFVKGKEAIAPTKRGREDGTDASPPAKKPRRFFKTSEWCFFVYKIHVEQITVSHGIYLCAGKPTKVTKKSGDKTKPKGCILAVGELSTSSTTPKCSDALQAEEQTKSPPAKSPPALSSSPTPYALQGPSPQQSPSPHNAFFVPQEDPNWYEEGRGHQQSDEENEESQHNISDSGKSNFQFYIHYNVNI